MKCGAVLISIPVLVLAAGCATGPKVDFHEMENRIGVTAGGKPVAEYRHGPELTKPILYPIYSPSGIRVNRSFPFEKVEGESEDHPHHTGLFFTYDLVNGEGFWNNTTSPPQIRHVETRKMKAGSGRGILSVVLHWVGEEGRPLLEEQRVMTFSGGDHEHVIDFDITLTALGEKVAFEDTKEGMFGIRVAHWLKEKGGTGRYLSSNGDETEANVWGRRAAWVRLEGEKDGNTVGIAILNHPESVNHPTFWHARAYGLFAANPLGQLVFETARKVENPESFHLTLAPGGSARFRFRVIVYEGPGNLEEMEAAYKDYAR